MAKRLDIVEEKFLKTIKENNLINNGDVIVVGVSGGPDSITLLTCLNKYKEKLKCKLIVAHINHLIRKDSTEDEQFVENVCKKMNIQFYAKRVEILKMSQELKKGTEETGRMVRYEFFDEIARKENANKIAIAHNMNDNAETMLLNLIRGCGMSGLEGIQPSEYNNKYIRPLINCKRNEIEEYCQKNDLQPRIDSTNKENIYKRNIIRNELLPFIKNINPNIIETLSKTSKIIRTNNEYIKEESIKEYQKIKLVNGFKETSKEKDKEKGYNINQNDQIKNDLGNVVFEIYEFNKEPEAIKQNLILLAINELTGSTRNIDKNNVDDIIKLAKNNIGKKYIIINKNLKIIVKNKKIFIISL